MCKRKVNIVFVIKLQDVPIPLFMQQNKPENDWTEDEKKMVQEYERKCKELNEEREKFRKVCISLRHKIEKKLM